MNLVAQPPTLTDGYGNAYTLDPTGSPVYFAFAPDAVGTATKAKLVITITDDTAGSTITIAQAAAGVSVVFTFVDVLDGSNQLPSNGTVLEWAGIIGEAAGIAGSYFVYASGSTIVVEAVQTGSYFTLALTSTVATASTTAGVDGDRAQQLIGYNYAQWVAVQQMSGTTPVKQLAILVASAPEGGRYVFDVSRVLQTITPFTLPTRAQVERIACTGQYRLVYGEQFAGGLDTYTGLPSSSNISRVQRYTLGVSGTRLCMPGVWTDQNAYSNNTDYWPSLVDGGSTTDTDDVRPVKWLSRRPYQINLRREDTPYWPVHVAILPYRAESFPTALYELYGARYGHDGQLIDEYTVQVGADITEAGVYCLDLYSLLVDVGDPDLVARVNYELRYAGVAITEQLVLYIVNEDDGVQSFPIYWQGSIGVLEHFTLLGYRATQQRTDRERIQATIIPPLSGATYGGDRDANPSLMSAPRLRVTANTGWVDELTYEYLKDLTASLRAWTIGSSGLLDAMAAAGYNVDGVDATQWVALSVVDSEWEVNTNDGQYSAEITFEVSAQLTPVML